MGGTQGVLVVLTVGRHESKLVPWERGGREGVAVGQVERINWLG